MQDDEKKCILCNSRGAYFDDFFVVEQKEYMQERRREITQRIKGAVRLSFCASCLMRRLWGKQQTNAWKAYLFGFVIQLIPFSIVLWSLIVGTENILLKLFIYISTLALSYGMARCLLGLLREELLPRIFTHKKALLENPLTAKKLICLALSNRSFMFLLKKTVRWGNVVLSVPKLERFSADAVLINADQVFNSTTVERISPIEKTFGGRLDLRFLSDLSERSLLDMVRPAAAMIKKLYRGETDLPDMHREYQLEDTVSTTSRWKMSRKTRENLFAAILVVDIVFGVTGTFFFGEAAILLAGLFIFPIVFFWDRKSD